MGSIPSGISALAGLVGLAGLELVGGVPEPDQLFGVSIKWTQSTELGRVSATLPR
jgi:hypothetical protein